MKKILLSIIMLLTIIPMVSQAQTLFPNRGGTGTTVIPTEGYVLVGQSNGTYLPVATTTLGFAGGGGAGGGGAVDSVNGQTGVVILDADDIAEGTNIFFTTERAQDVTGGMVTGNTETRITVTYQDGDGTIDFVVDNDLGNYDSTNLIIEAVNFEATNTEAEDDIATYDASTGGFTFESPTELCVRITGSSELCDGDDGGGGSTGGAVDVLSNVATDRILGRTTAGTGDSEQLTASAVRTLINVEDGATADQDLSGLLPKAGGTMTGNIALNGNYLSGDGGDEGVFVDSSGNVGIGTASPSYKLDTGQNNTDQLRLGRLLAGAWDGVDGSYVFVQNSSLAFNSGNYALAQSGVGATLINAASGRSIGFRIGNGTVLHVSSNRNVGIGTTAPDTKLHVAGAMTQEPLSSDPADPDAGNSVQWVSDGTGSGSAGDVMMKINVGGTTKTVTLVDFSTLT